MANEIRGFLSEVVLEYALIKAVELSGVKGTVRWNVKPQNMSIKPDFTIGEDPNDPLHIIMITSSGSSSDSHKKMWRNLSEMQEVKSQLPRMPKVMSIYFRSNIKKGIPIATNHLYDSFLFIEQKTYGKKLLKWVDDNIENKAKNHDTRRELLLSYLSIDFGIREAFQGLVDDLVVLLKQENKELRKLWKLMRQDNSKVWKVREIRKTFIRRGLGKLLVFPENFRYVIYENFDKSKIPSDDLPDYVFRLDFIKKTIAGSAWSEAGKEIRDVIRLLGPKTCESILQMCPASMHSWINPLRNLDRIQLHVDFVKDHYDEISEPDGLNLLLKRCYDDPVLLSGHDSDEKVWIFEIIVSLLKAKTGSLQGYGYSKLFDDTGLPAMNLSSFLKREKNWDNKKYKMLSTGLSHRFKNDIQPDDLTTLQSKVETWVIKENLEDRLIPYNKFDPLLWLLEIDLKKHDIAYEPKCPWVGWLNEYSGVGKKIATTDFVRVGSTLVHWKSSHGSHTNDKTKEISARIRNVRYQFKNGDFFHREGIKNFFLIIDGSFTEKNLKDLSRAGWDRIFYADQMDELINAL